MKTIPPSWPILLIALLLIIGGVFRAWQEGQDGFLLAGAGLICVGSFLATEIRREVIQRNRGGAGGDIEMEEAAEWKRREEAQRFKEAELRAADLRRQEEIRRQEEARIQDEERIRQEIRAELEKERRDREIGDAPQS